MEQLKQMWSDVQAWWQRLTARERRMVAIAGSAAAVFVLFITLFSFASRADAIRTRTKLKLAQLQEAQQLAANYRDAERKRNDMERQLQASNLQLLSYLEDKGTRAGLEIPTMNPKGDVPVGDGSIVQSAVDLTLTDVELGKLYNFLTSVESGAGVVKVTYLRIEPRPSNETVTAWASISTYHSK